MTAPKQIIAQPILGACNKMVNPGDRVVFVTTGWGNAYINEGTYLGYIECDSRWSGNTRKAKVEVHATRNIWMHEDGTPHDWNKHGSFSQVKDKLTLMKDVPYTYRTTLQLNRMVPVKE